MVSSCSICSGCAKNIYAAHQNTALILVVVVESTICILKCWSFFYRIMGTSTNMIEAGMRKKQKQRIGRRVVFCICICCICCSFIFFVLALKCHLVIVFLFEFTQVAHETRAIDEIKSIDVYSILVFLLYAYIFIHMLVYRSIYR